MLNIIFLLLFINFKRHLIVKNFGYNIGLYTQKLSTNNLLISEDVSNYIAKDMYRCLKNKNIKNSKVLLQRRLLISYILVKFLYLSSILFQLWLLDYFFQDEYYKESTNFKDLKLTNLQRFPRIIFCKLDLQTLYDYQRHWVQCILTDSVYIEKAYLIIKCWLFFLALLNVLSLLYYTQFMFEIARKIYINSMLKYEDEMKVGDETLDKLLTVD